MTSSDTAGLGSSSITMATDSLGTGRDLRVLCDRVEVLEQKAGSAVQSDSYLRNRIGELERSERSLLLQLYQLVSSSKLPSMQHSQRLDQRLIMLREEVRTMSQEKERGERVWRDRLQRCHRQLKAKEDEMGRQCQYFENFKTQLQHKLGLARDREQILQNRIYTLEKQLLDMTVSAATGMATIGAVRITGTHLDEQDRLPSLRGEGEGEEEKREERRKQWQPSVGMERKEKREGDDAQAEKDIEGERHKDSKYTSNEARLQGFIISLQEDLKVLLEREEGMVTERRGLMEQLQEAQENNLFMGCKVDEMKAEVQQLKLSESSLLEEVEDLREENQRLQQILRDSANQTPSQSSPIPESTCLSPGNIPPSCSPAVCSEPNNTPSYATAMGKSTAGSAAEVQPVSDEGSVRPNPSAVSPVHHQAAAESTQKTPSENEPLKRFTNFQSLTLTTESLDEFKLGNWCSKGVLNLEEIPSEESDALRDAYRSLGLGEDLQALREQRDHLEVSLQHTQEQLRVTVQENAQLKLQLRKQAEEQETELRFSSEKISDDDNLLQSSTTQDDTILAQDDLVQALNHENRALADRIQELLAHIELREEEITKEQTQFKENISRLEEGSVRLEEENQEQCCLVSELTKKTEDDLNTIMELQQKLAEGREEKEESQANKKESRLQWECAIKESFLQNNLEESVDSLVASVLKGEEEEGAQLMFNQEIDTSTSTTVFGCQNNNQNDSLKNVQQSTLHVSALTDQVSQLKNSAQSLKEEQEELTASINSLREQQREVALSVKTQTEEKQQLTRTVWGLKEEKDCINQSLAGLKMEKEQLSRAVCGLKDDRDQFIRSMSGLKEEKEQLTKSLSPLERDKEAAVESLSREKEERDQIKQSLQTLQAESEQLNQAVLYLKQERDKLTNSLKCLKEQSDREQLSCTSKEDRDGLIKSVNSLKEEKERTENSIRCLKEEEKQITLLIQGLREERNSLQALPIQTEERSLLNPVSACVTKETETLAGEYATQRCQTKNHWGDSIQEQSDLMKEIEALGQDLRRSREELDKSHVEVKRLRSELCQSEARREEAERKAAQAAEKVMRLTDASGQMEETRMENDSLTTQVKELQSKLAGLLKERTDALSRKAQVEEQYNILTAQLKAKTVALEELNSEYIALKRGQGSRDDLSTALVSLRSRYNEIRAKYDAVLKRKSQTDLDIAPLKAKLCCLVVKCQERNSLLVQMMKAMHRQGRVDPKLTQQVEQLLSDAALQDYTAAFTPGTCAKTKDYCTGLAPEFISKFQGFTSALIPDQACPFVSTSANKQQPNGITQESAVSKSEKHTSIVTAESSTDLQGCSVEVIPAATGTLKKNAKSPVPTSPVQGRSSVQAPPSPKESLITAQLSPSARRNLNGSSMSPTPHSSSSCVSVSRRLSSPEKILNLHEQLQKTLMSSYQSKTHESRGRAQQPRNSLPLSAPADQSSASLTKNLGFNSSHTNALLVTAGLSQAKCTPAETTKPATSNKSTTLFNAVAARSAKAASSPTVFTNHGLKVDVSKMTTSVLSSSSNFSFATSEPSKDKPISSSASDMAVSPNPTKKITAIPEVSDPTHPLSTSLTLRTTTFDSDVANPRTTASNATAPRNSTAPKDNMTSKTDGADRTCHGFAFATSRFQSASSTVRSSKFARKSGVATLEETKTARPKAEAPAEVRCVEVLKTVGQSGLMIGWERPPLDELGCSNGTFVYGYRVFVDGDFHKSVMSSACTKCILENVDLSVPVHISVQTLGSNEIHQLLSENLPLKGGALMAPSLRCTAIYSCSSLRDRPNLHLS